MKKLLLATALVAFSLPALAAEPADPTIVIHMADLQKVADKLGDVPFKYAAPIMQDLQSIVQKAEAAKVAAAKTEGKKK